MIGNASTTTPTHSDLLLLQKKHEKTIHTGRLTWNLQINHLERKMIFQTSMIMFPVNLQGCNTNVVLVMLPFPRLEGHATFRILSTNGDRIDIGSIAAGESRECWGGKKNSRRPQEYISPSTHLCWKCFFFWAGKQPSSSPFYSTKNYKTPKKIRKRMLGEAAATFVVIERHRLV